MSTHPTPDELAFKAAYDSLSGADYDEVETAVQKALDAYRAALPVVHFVCSGYPSPDGTRFIELETADGKSVALGHWQQRADGLAELVLPCLSAGAA